MPLEIIIAGAGVAGLCAAIGLARHGHKVRVCERRDDNDGEEETLGGIQMQPNAVKILRDWGALETVDRVAHESVQTDVRRHNTGETLLLIDMESRGGTRFGPRKTLKKALEEFATRHGARVDRGRQVVAVRDDGSRPIAVFGDHSSEAADMIIGADGTASRVRRSLYPSFQPKVLPECVFQVSVPLDWMQESPETKALLRHSPGAVVHMSPGRVVVCSPSFDLGIFDLQLLGKSLPFPSNLSGEDKSPSSENGDMVLQLQITPALHPELLRPIFSYTVRNFLTSIDLDYPLSADPDPDFLTGRMYDMSHVRRRVADHEPGVIKVVEKAKSVWKWRLREVHGLPEWSSDSGRVLLIGDASHGFVPHAGQGSAMGVEDGAVLAELLADTFPQDDIKALVKLFEAIRRPRCELIRKFATIQGAGWTVKDPKKIQARDQKLAKYEQQQASTRPDPSGSISSPGFQKWLDEYDISHIKEEVSKAKAAAAKASQARL